MKSYKGFTLIELLVVIAIIGLLAAVILASLGNARGKGVNAAVQSSLNQARSQAELYAQDHGNSYSGFCNGAQSAEGLGGVSGPGILLSAASSTKANVQTGTGGVLKTGDGTKVTCNDAGDSWTVEAPFYNSTVGSPVMWCIDSTGASGQKTAVNAGTAACP